MTFVGLIVEEPKKEKPAEKPVEKPAEKAEDSPRKKTVNKKVK